MKLGTEDNIQAAFFAWADRAKGQTPDLELLFAIPNGGHRHKLTAYKLKLTGTKAGVWDVFFPVSRYSKTDKEMYPGLWIEFKSPSGKLTDNQKRWGELMRAQGHKTAVCFDWEDAKKIVLEYLGK